MLKQFLRGVKTDENWCSAHESRNNSRGTRQSDILNDATLFQNVCHMRLNATFQEQTILNWETDDFGSITILNFFLSWHGSLRPWLQQVKGEASGWESAGGTTRGARRTDEAWWWVRHKKWRWAQYVMILPEKIRSWQLSSYWKRYRTQSS